MSKKTEAQLALANAINELADSFNKTSEVYGGLNVTEVSAFEGIKSSGIAVIKEVDTLVKRIEELEGALSELIDKASECDSWESFPVQYLDAAQKALEGGDE